VEVTQVSLRIRLSASVLAAVVATGLPGSAGAADQQPSAVYSFGTLKTPTVEAARAQAQSWLDSVGKTDEAARTAFNAVWESDRPLIDRVADTLALGNADVAKLLAEARDPAAPAPKDVPELLKDNKLPVYFRSNLALAYAKALSGKRVFEESLDALKAAVPEQVVDPAAYYFHKAVAEHGLVQKKEAAASIARLLDDVAETPERYRMVATLMFLDMQGWKDEDKDLGNIARLMDNIERRLDLSRGGPKTQEIQKKVVFRLDELIKDIENQMKMGGQVPCPGTTPRDGSGRQQQPQGGNRPDQPMPDSQIAKNSGPGVVDPKKLQNLAQNWGKLPEKERAKAMMELTKDLPPRYREVIEDYFKSLARSQDK